MDAEMEQAFGSLTSGYERNTDVSTGNETGQPERQNERKEKKKKSSSGGIPDVVKDIGIVALLLFLTAGMTYGMLVAAGTDLTVFHQAEPTQIPIESVSDQPLEPVIVPQEVQIIK